MPGADTSGPLPARSADGHSAGTAGADAAVAEDAVAPTAARLTLAEQRVRSAWLFLVPMIVALLLVAAWPLIRTIVFSFTDANLSDLSGWEFIGLANYLYLFEDPLWWKAVGNTLFF